MKTNTYNKTSAEYKNKLAEYKNKIITLKQKIKELYTIINKLKNKNNINQSMYNIGNFEYDIIPGTPQIDKNIIGRKIIKTPKMKNGITNGQMFMDVNTNMNNMSVAIGRRDNNEFGDGINSPETNLEMSQKKSLENYKKFLSKLDKSLPVGK